MEAEKSSVTIVKGLVLEKGDKSESFVNLACSAQNTQVFCLTDVTSPRRDIAQSQAGTCDCLQAPGKSTHSATSHKGDEGALVPPVPGEPQLGTSSASTTVPEPGSSSLGLSLSVGNLETPMEGGLLRTVTEIPTRVRLCSQMNSCAGQPPAPAQTQMWDGWVPLAPCPLHQPVSQCRAWPRSGDRPDSHSTNI